MIATIVLAVALLTRRQVDVAALGRQGWRKKHFLRHGPAALPEPSPPPPPGPLDVISALIKMSSSEARGAVNKGSENGNCLLGTVPGALEVSGREASVGV